MSSTALGEVVRWEDHHGQEHRSLIVREIVKGESHAVEVPGAGWLEWPIDPLALADAAWRLAGGVWITP